MNDIILRRLAPIVLVFVAAVACADDDAIHARIDAIDGADGGLDGVADTITTDAGADTSGDVGTATDGTSTPDVTANDTASPGETDAGPGDATAADSGDGGSDTVTGDVGPSEDPGTPWVLGRPIRIASSDGGALIGTPVPTGGGRYRALVPVHIGSGSVVADGQSIVPPNVGAHAAIVALSGDVTSSELGTVVYLDGSLVAPQAPRVAVCGGSVYATINEQSGANARFVRLDRDLEAIDLALLSARPGIGNSVKLGPPVCGGPGVVTTLDAVGGALFTAPDGARAEFAANQSENRTLILNGTRVFEQNAAQVVSASSMRILMLAAGPEQVLFYVGEATVERQIGNTTLMPGDQLVYNHDYAVGMGGSISSQAWFGKQDIALIATSPDGRFAVVWTDVIAGATPSDPETVEIVISVFEDSGARAWTTRSSAWAIDKIAFGDDGDLRVAGRFRSLEVIGIATAPVGSEDAFVAVLSGSEGARRRVATFGMPGLAARPVGPIMQAPGSGECASAGWLDAVLVAAGAARVGIGAGAEARCDTEVLEAGDNQLRLALSETHPAEDAVDLWLSVDGGPIAADDAVPWPAGAHAGPLRARFLNPR